MTASRERRRWRGAIAIAAVAAAAMIVGACENPSNSSDGGGGNGSGTDEQETYTVTYNANGADSGSAPGDQTKTEGTDLTLADNSGNLARDGFTFAGWNTADDGSGDSYGEGATYSTDADLTLYAEWADYEIGDTGPAGGVIFYDDEADGTDDIAGARYLEAWTADEAAEYEWKTSNTDTSGTSTAVGSGYENTYNAMTGTQHPAAEVVRNAAHGGYTDWFLPSKDELNLMYQNRGVIDGLAVAYYWSSSYDGSYDAWAQWFGSEFDQASYDRFNDERVRAVRALSDQQGPGEALSTYTVTYNANGADSGSAPGEQTKTEGTDLTLADNADSLDVTGYQAFAGWNTSSDGTGTSYAEGESYTDDADLTLYAQWSAIGETGEAGGIIFYDDEADGTDDIAGARYLEAAPDSTEWDDIQWGDKGTEIGGDAQLTGIGDGQAATNAVVAHMDGESITGTPAQVADELSHGGQTDWFLPSKDELNLMYQNKGAIGGFASSGSYWSSSEFDGINAWYQDFNDVGFRNGGGKSFPIRVRAVRAF